MITKEQHGSCSKDAGNKECDGATKGDSDKMNGFDPRVNESLSTNMSQISKENIVTDTNGQTKDQSPLKIHSELSPSNKNGHKGEKTKHEANEGIELSRIPDSEVGNGTKSKNTLSSVQLPPSSSSVIQIDQEQLEIQFHKQTKILLFV